MEYIILRNGYKIPKICFGTDIVDYCPSIKEKTIKIIKTVIKSIIHPNTLRKYKKEKGIIRCCKHSIEYGCVFFDTSRAYSGSEQMLKDTLKKHNRDDYYICTKLSNYSQLHGISAKDALLDSMKQLGVEYVDLYLIHWPVKGKYVEYWKQLEELYKDGLVKAIGVSNCKIHHLQEIEKVAEIIPMVNEVELHPLLCETELRDYCQDHGIQIMAYTSTARMDFRLSTSRRMKSVCEETGKSLSQVILRWHIQNGVIPIFNTSSLNHFKHNMEVFDFNLTEEQMKIIDSMNINARTRYDSDNCEWDRL